MPAGQRGGRGFIIMANFYTDNPEIKYFLSHPLLKRIVELRERNYADADKYDYAPANFEDAIDSYERVMELAGDVCANIIAPNAESVDAEGPRCENGRMIYASKTYENLDATVKALPCLADTAVSTSLWLSILPSTR